MAADEPESKAIVSRASWGPGDMFRASLAAVGLIIAGAVAIVVVIALLPVLGLSSPRQSTVSVAVLALEAVLVIPAWVWGPGKYGGHWAALGLRRFSVLRAIILCVLCLALMLAMNVGWDAVRQQLGLSGQPDVLPLFGGGLQGLVLAIVLGGIVAPFAEEVFFRGFLYAGLRSRWGVGWGMLTSGIIFALVHIIPGAIPPIFVMGMLFAVIYEITGSIWPCVALHGAINSLAFVAAYLVETYPSLAPLTR